MTPVIVDERKRGPGPHGLPPTVYLNDKSCPLDLVLERLVLPTIVWLFLTYAAWWEEGRGKGSRFTKVDEMSPRVRHQSPTLRCPIPQREQHNPKVQCHFFVRCGTARMLANCLLRYRFDDDNLRYTAEDQGVELNGVFHGISSTSYC